MNLNHALSDYKTYHQNRINIMIHMIGIPLILLSIFLFLSWPELVFHPYLSIPLSFLLFISGIITYWQHSFKSALLSTAFFLPMLIIGLLIKAYLPHWLLIISLSLFLAGWALQFVGHIIEGSKPAFTHQLIHLIAGPLYIINEIYDAISGKKSI